MENIDLYREFSELLSPKDQAQVLAALRQDTLVWERLQEPGFFDQAAQWAGKEVDRWNPGWLALVALKASQKPETFVANPMVEIDPILVEPVMQVYQNARASQSSGPQTLEEAGLLALALRERRRKSGNWSFMVAEIQQHNGPRGEAPLGWRAAMACLYGLIPDPEGLMRVLLTITGGKPCFEWLVHARLSQPASLQSHQEVFLALLKNQPLEIQLGVLRSLSLHGRSELTRKLAGLLATDHPDFGALRLHTGLAQLTLYAVATRAFKFQQLASLYQLSGNRVQAASLLQSAEGALKHWMAGLYLQEINLLGEMEPGKRDAESRLHMVMDQARRLEGELGPAILGQALPPAVFQKIPANFKDPVLQIRQAVVLSSQGESLLARELVSQAVAALVERVSAVGLPFRGEFVYDWQPEFVLETLVGLGALSEALTLARALVTVRPVDVALLQETSRISEQLGDAAGACYYAQSAVALEPQSPDSRRRLGYLWIASAEWQKAQTELEALLALAPQSSVADRLLLAQAALHNRALERVVTVCEGILQESSDHGIASGYLGRALAAQGDLDRAATHLNRATLLAPTEGAPWLALIKILRDRKENQRALETLRSAVLAIPEMSEEAMQANLALGEICLEYGLVNEALPALGQAYRLHPESIQAAYLYGKTLFEIHKAPEALAVLENTRPAWEENRPMAYVYALAARAQGNLDAAIIALEIALRPNQASIQTFPAAELCGNGGDGQFDPPIAWRLLYARVLLGELPEFRNESARVSLPRDVCLARAEHSVQCILSREPAHYEARFYKARLLLEKGDPQAALALYRSLAEIQSIPEHELYGPVQWGMGRAALQLGQVDTALVALKEASHAMPDSLYVQRDLAEACARVELRQEALLAAQHALQLAPDHVENLVWYAGFVAALGERRTALDALECAIQLDPARHDLRVRLAEWHIQAGSLGAGRTHLDALQNFSKVGSDLLRRVSDLYLLIDDAPSALACLERAMQAGDTLDMTLWYDAARLLDMLNRAEEALALTQQALADPARGQGQESIPLYLLQADLLNRSGRGQGSLASLEKALRVAEELPQNSAQNPLMRVDALAEIHERFSGLLLEMDNLPEALYHSEKALDLHPERTALRYKVAGLALSALQFERAARMVEVVKTDHLGLMGLKSEIALELEPGLGSVACASGNLEEDPAGVPADARLLSAYARRLARRGAWLPARQVFENALGLAKGSGGDTPVEVWLGEAALETQHWGAALSILDAYARRNPNEARAHFALARALVICAERMRLCQALDCRAHAPGPSVLAEAAYQQFEASIQTAARLLNHQGAGGQIIRRWQIRGQAVFRPSVQTARDLATLTQSREDVVALVATLGLLGRRQAMIQAAQRYPEDRDARLHMAINLTDDPERQEGLQIARKLAEEQFEIPLVHALHARLAALAGSLAEALEAYEQALALWPGEAGWHDSAGDLAHQMHAALPMLTHREQALALEPARVSYALKLSEACLESDNAARAVEVLEAAGKVEKDRPEVWVALAQAYRQARKKTQALEAALKAGQVDSSSGQGFVLAAEISLEMGQLAPALEYARSAVQREPSDVSALQMLVRVLEMQGLSEEAITALSEAPVSIRDTFVITFELARLLYRARGPQAALEVLEQLAVEYPDDSDLLSFLAFTQYECGNTRQAERSGFKSLRLNPNQPELTLMLGRLEHRSGQLDQALHLLSEAVRMSPNHLEALLELGGIYQERREATQALQVYRQAIQIAPHDYRAYYQSGVILRDNKDYPGAESMLRRAVDLAQDNAAIRRQLLAVIALNLVHNKQEVTTTR